VATHLERREAKPVTTAKRVVIWVAVLALIGTIGAAAAATYYWRSLAATNSLPREQVVQKVMWRLRLYARKATGRVPDLSWSELWQMSRQQGGFGLELLSMGVSPEGGVRNAYISDDDFLAGESIYARQCAMCHGIGAVGSNGPALNRPGLKHGDSDLSIYKVLRDGVPETAMPATGLSLVENWQVVGYLKSLMINGTSREIAEKYHLKIKVSPEEIHAAGSKTDEWLTYSGSLDGRRYTPLKEIAPANVSRLRVLWAQQFDTSDPVIEAAPIVVDGTIFTTEPPANVVALDAKSGEVIWRYDRTVSNDLALCCGRVNRGLAILGNMLFLGALDGWLVAIDANTGRMIWETQVVKGSEGFTMTGAPLVVNQSVIVGVAGGDYGTRGLLAAYDPATGRQQWKFDTIPPPGQPGHETWQNGWETGGGATWITGSYDPSLGLIYWGVGNPAPDFQGDFRLGDNLYTNSVIALRADTGKLAWYFQFTPHDEHDWDSTQTPILTDLSINGTMRKVICWVNRNGFYYVLDRVTGEFLVGVPFVEQNWAKGLDSKGRPILDDARRVTAAGTLTRPALAGGTNWQNPALDHERGLIFVHATEGASVFTKSADEPVREDNLRPFLSSGASTMESPTLYVRALVAATGEKKWEYLSPRVMQGVSAHSYSYSGLLATGSGLVFGASGGALFALDSSTGEQLWYVYLGGETRAAPTSFTLDGRQVIAVSIGRALFLFGL
jgi:alcohol dehydrogenase (cytochrome c)